MSTVVDLSLDALEAMLNDEVGCESLHPDSVCSVEVTHRLQGCEDGKVVCRNAAKASEYRIHNTDIKCSDCMRLARSCWLIFSI